MLKQSIGGPPWPPAIKHMKRHASRSERGTQPTTRRSGVPREADRSNSQTGSDPVASLHHTAGNQAVGTTVQRQQESGQEKVGEWWGGRGYREPTETEQERGFATDDVQSAVTAWMQNEGIAPQSGGYDLADYVDVDMIISSESSNPTTSARIRVGPNGNLLPTMATIEERRPEGGYEEGTLQTATTWIQFEFHKIPDGGLYIQTSRLDTKQRPNGTVITTTKAADTDMSIRGRENYTLASDGRITGALSDMIQSAGIEPGRAASMRAPTGQQSGQQPETAGGAQMGITGAATGAASGTFIKNMGFSAGDVSDAALGGLGAGGIGLGVGPVGGGKIHTVKKGDTLWDIAKQEYGDGEKWGVIFEANKKTEQNPDGIEDPDLIHPDQELVIPPQRKADQFDRAEYDAPESYGVGEGKF
jgi:hypothetical protein